MQPNEDQQKIKQQAIGLLSRREYSFFELEQRFLRDFSEQDVCEVLQSLVDDGYQSDQRFTESFVRNKVGQNQGLSKIRYQIKSKGIRESLLADVIEELAPDWFEMAYELIKRKFNGDDLTDRKLQAKLIRFGMQRGFSMEQCQYALQQLKEESVSI